MARRQHSVQPCEGNVISGQSKVEKAKYVHTENNLRKTLVNINESFKRTNKRLIDETETLRKEMENLRRSVQKIRQEKERRMAGECCSNRRPHRAERLLFDESIVKLEPFSETVQQFVYKSRARKAKGKYLMPLRLHQTISKPMDKRPPEENKEVDEGRKERHDNHEVLMKNHVSKAARLPWSNEIGGRRPDLRSKVWRKQCKNIISTITNDTASPKRRDPVFIPTIPICDIVDIRDAEDCCPATNIQSKTTILPPLEKIPEGVEPKTYLLRYSHTKHRDRIT